MTSQLTPERRLPGLFYTMTALILFALYSVASTGCSGRFVPRERLQELNKKWAEEKVYELTEDIDIGNGKTMKKGTKVKIWIESDTFSVRVKAYDHRSSRETAIGKNIVFMYEGQFKNDNFQQDIFEKKLKALITASAADPAEKTDKK